jgi:Ala-tRNA(Pro) deacylase
MPATKLKQFLDRNNVPYLTIAHSPAYTAQQIAQVAHVSGRELAKTVILKIDGGLAMAVLPATHHVDLELLRDSLDARTVELAHEVDFETAFPGCELGAMPPFGNLWHVPVYVAEALAEDEQIAFNAGTHTELIQMAYVDFERLVKPRVLHLAETAV